MINTRLLQLKMIEAYIKTILVLAKLFYLILYYLLIENKNVYKFIFNFFLPFFWLCNAISL